MVIERDSLHHVECTSRGDHIRAFPNGGDLASNGVTQWAVVGSKPERLQDQHGPVSVHVGRTLLDKSEDTQENKVPLSDTSATKRSG